MNTAVQLFRTTILEYSVYRLNFLLWRFRIVLNFLIIFFLWKSVYADQSTLFGYTNSHIQTYVFVSTLLVSVVLSTRLPELAGEIINGDIIGRLIKPYPTIKTYAFRDVADKTVNIICAIIEIFILFILFRPQIALNLNLLNLVMFALFLIVGIVLSFYINLILSFVGFWSNDVWAPRFIYFIIVVFFAGSYFPLDILPKFVYWLLLITPFPYLFFLPSKIIIQGFGFVFSQTPMALVIPLAWLFALKRISALIWIKGMRNYSFFGR